ncbi:hypothetical protein Tco_1325487, partial [Tanacetum coccineum]
LAKHIWENLRDKMGNIRCHNDLKSIVTLLSQTKAKRNLRKVVNRLVLAAVVYYIWQERNWRIFKQEKRIVDQIQKIITENVKMRLMSFKVKQTSAVLKVADTWNLKWKSMYFRADVEKW